MHVLLLELAMLPYTFANTPRIARVIFLKKLSEEWHTSPKGVWCIKELTFYIYYARRLTLTRFEHNSHNATILAREGRRCD